VIPQLGDEGHLPPGRYRTSLQEVEDRFVNHEEFAHSASRRNLWHGFQVYLTAWASAEEAMGVSVLIGVWIGGSFPSSKLDPEDIDIAAVFDRRALDALEGQVGVGAFRRLVSNRSKCLDKYGVEPHPVRWVRVATPWDSDAQSPASRDYFHDRGTLDDWMQRARPAGDKVAPRPEDADPARGYLEVEW
jgi:hypothetical protein